MMNSRVSRTDRPRINANGLSAVELQLEASASIAALESAVLGAILQFSDAMQLVAATLRPDMFSRPAHQAVYTACLALHDASQPVDMLTVKAKLTSLNLLQEAGGLMGLTELVSDVVSDANVEYHALLIRQDWLRRRLQAIGVEAQAKAKELHADPFDLADDVIRETEKAVSGVMPTRAAGLTAVIADVVTQVEQVRAAGTGMRGPSTGIAELDRMTSGLQRGKHYVVAARPAMGKSDNAIHLMRAAKAEDVYCRMYTLEMDATECGSRLLAQSGGLHRTALRDGTIDMMALNEAVAYVEKTYGNRVSFVDKAGLSLRELRADALAWTRKLPADAFPIIVVDYLQLVVVERGERNRNREQEVSEISRGLKILARETSGAVVSLSQLNRSVETRGGDNRPRLSDLRESGAIEQDADAVLFLHRPEYYGQEQDEHGNSTKGMAEIIVAKQRGGATGIVQCRYHADTGAWTDLTRAYTPREQAQPQQLDLDPGPQFKPYESAPF